jgi:hypothetical protein
VDAASFWDMTYKEILASIEGYQKRQKSELQTKALIAYRQADTLAMLVGIVFGSKQQHPALQDAFPGIFPELEQPRQQSWEIMKARVEAYAAEKRMRGENGGNNS